MKTNIDQKAKNNYVSKGKFLQLKKVSYILMLKVFYYKMKRIVKISDTHFLTFIRLKLF